VAWSPDGTRLAAGALDGRIRLWEGASGQEQARLDSGDSVWSVAFNADGTLLASGSVDGNVRLWDVASGAERARLNGESGRILSVAFNRKGTRLAAGTADGDVRLWDLRPFLLLNPGSAPSPRAALLAEALQRLWRWRLDGFAWPVAWMEAVRPKSRAFPDSAPLHPGYNRF
jgi:WD40 repeat protein